MSEVEQGNAKVERRGQTKVGIVTSNKMTKTVVVRVEAIKAHPMYKRSVRSTSKFMAHDPEGRCQIGDRVVIVASRPISRHKCWRVQKVLVSVAAKAAAEESKS